MHQQSLLKNSQKLLLLKHILSPLSTHFTSLSSPQLFDNILRTNIGIEVGVVDGPSDRREGFIELNKRPYLSSDPWGPFRRFVVSLGDAEVGCRRLNELADSEK